MDNEFSLVRVNNVQELYDNLQKLMQNKRHIETLTVDHVKAEIKVDLSVLANGFGHQDFKLRLRPNKTQDAESILRRLKNESEITRGVAEELFETLVVGH